MAEIIQIHVGQAGVQIANACWELYCLEHGINNDGTLCDCPSDNTFTNFFDFKTANKVVPRAILVDAEPTVIDQIRTGPYGCLYCPSNLITGKEDSGSNYARGYFTMGAELIDITMEAIRNAAESCTNLRGFVLFRSVGGGTGSGLGNLIAEHLLDTYEKLNKFEFIIFPSPSLSPLIVEPYNALLATHFGMDSIDCTFIIDNEALYDVCSKKLNINAPKYKNLNRIIGQTASNFTTSQRFSGSSNVTFSEFQVNLVPYPRLHYPVLSYAPFIPGTGSGYTRLSTEQVTTACFDPSNQLVRCNPMEGKYMSSVLLYRGDVSTSEIHSSISRLRSSSSIRFADWSGLGFKVGTNSEPPCSVPGGGLGNTDKSLVVLSNNTIIQKAWCRLIDKYSKLYSKRAFIHHYISEGLEESSLQEACEDICTLISDYKEVYSGENRQETAYNGSFKKRLTKWENPERSRTPYKEFVQEPGNPERSRARYQDIGQEEIITMRTTSKSNLRLNESPDEKLREHKSRERKLPDEKSGSEKSHNEKSRDERLLHYAPGDFSSDPPLKTRERKLPDEKSGSEKSHNEKSRDERLLHYAPGDPSSDPPLKTRERKLPDEKSGSEKSHNEKSRDERLLHYAPGDPSSDPPLKMQLGGEYFRESNSSRSPSITSIKTQIFVMEPKSGNDRNEMAFSQARSLQQGHDQNNLSQSQQDYDSNSLSRPQESFVVKNNSNERIGLALPIRDEDENEKKLAMLKKSKSFGSVNSLGLVSSKKRSKSHEPRLSEVTFRESKRTYYTPINQDCRPTESFVVNSTDAQNFPGGYCDMGGVLKLPPPRSEGQEILGEALSAKERFCKSKCFWINHNYSCTPQEYIINDDERPSCSYQDSSNDQCNQRVCPYPTPSSTPHMSYCAPIWMNANLGNYANYEPHQEYCANHNLGFRPRKQKSKKKKSCFCDQELGGRFDSSNTAVMHPRSNNFVCYQDEILCCSEPNEVIGLDNEIVLPRAPGNNCDRR